MTSSSTFERDSYLKKKELELHEEYHRSLAQKGIPDDLLENKRIQVLPLAEEVLGKGLNGKVLDIGCGTGYLSVWLALNRKVEEVHAMEITKSAVEELIPMVIDKFKAPKEKVIPVRGSYSSLPGDPYYDHILAFGALHHSNDLFHSLKSCWQALKPGGILISQEPSTGDLTPNSSFIEQGARKERFKGLKEVRRDERDDNFFRECEYKTAAHHSGFDIVMFKDWHPKESAGLRQLPRKLLRKIRGQNKEKRKKIPDLLVKKKMMIFKKPEDPPSYIPHLWRTY